MRKHRNLVLAGVAGLAAVSLQGCLESLMGVVASMSGTICKNAIQQVFTDKGVELLKEAEAKCKDAKARAEEQGIEGAKIDELETSCVDALGGLLEDTQNAEQDNYTSQCVEQLKNLQNASVTELSDTVTEWTTKLDLSHVFDADWQTKVKSKVEEICAEYGVKADGGSSSGGEDEGDEETTAQETAEETTAAEEDEDAKDKTTAAEDDEDAKEDSRLFEVRDFVSSPAPALGFLGAFSAMTLVGVATFAVLRRRQADRVGLLAADSEGEGADA